MTKTKELKKSNRKKPTCSLIPLGGLGEIGKNMMVLECDDKIVIIDSGLAFPTEDQPGIDLIIPDISYILERKEQVLGIVLTHGHEDHIGALPYVLSQLKTDVYGTKMTLGMVSNKLDEHRLLDKINLFEIQSGEPIELGPFRFDFIDVAHSIVDGVGMCITTPAGRIIHSGDFKLDPTPVDDRVTDLATFGAFGQKGVDLLLADSTNVEREGYTLSESDVGQAFDDIVREAKGRVIIACFSSNIHRFQQVVNTASRFQRKIGVLGMSMIKNMRTAQELDYLSIPPNLWQRWSDVGGLPKDKQIILTTGSQGEPRSALARATVGENNDLQLTASDTIIISARTIPGNERRIGNMINQMFRFGCTVHYERVSEIHVSGHAAKEELKILHNIVKPNYFMPIHGEVRHLVHHAELAQELGMVEENVFVLENGERLILSPSGVERGSAVVSGKVLVDGKGVGDVDQVVLRDRKHLAQDGMVMVVLGLDAKTGAVVSGPDITTRGMAESTEENGILTEAVEVVNTILENEVKEALADQAWLQDSIRRGLKKLFKKRMMRFPMIIPVIMEL